MSERSEKLTVEALAPVAFRFCGQDVQLRPGERFTLPVAEARQLLSRARGKVRCVPQTDWLELWQEVDDLTHGLEPDDPHVAPILGVIVNDLDLAFIKGNREAFAQGASKLRAILHDDDVPTRGEGGTKRKKI